jgi:hypothetical protein
MNCVRRGSHRETHPLKAKSPAALPGFAKVTNRVAFLRSVSNQNFQMRAPRTIWLLKPML